MNNFTPRAQQVLHLARQEADRFNHGYVGTEHLLLGLIATEKGVAAIVLQSLGLNLEKVRLEVEKAVGVGPETKVLGNIPYTPRLKKVLALAGTEARAMNVDFVGTEHILLGLLRENAGVAARILNNLGVDIEKARNAIVQDMEGHNEPSALSNESGEGEGGGAEGGFGGGMDDNVKARPQKGAATEEQNKTPALSAFGRDLTALAKKGTLDPVVGRTEEIERVTRNGRFVIPGITGRVFLR